ncbi:MAG: type II CRISPR RNA-guided endonuclease Cas9 [Desulfobulbaceae bacterium]|nr:type II CRISPR RNA-guided endonuclease Cas9 [Desulfobulbaceae bacterium]
MSKQILGLDLGTNSIGWALLEESENKPSKIVGLGCRIFTKAVKAVKDGDSAIPKNMKRRDARLARRVVQRRARRKKRMLNYLVKLGLLPAELSNATQPEAILNKIGDPYALRAKALDEELTCYELGRVFLHLVQRRGFLSNRKTVLGDMVDDPDVQELLESIESKEDKSTERAKEETAFKGDIRKIRACIQKSGCRTLGEYLAGFDRHISKRNRKRDGGFLRTDRQMYREELVAIFQKQTQFHPLLTEEVKNQLEEIIFFQRPLKLRNDRVGKCSLEPSRNRARLARLECQRFRYLQDINNLQYFDTCEDRLCSLDAEQKATLEHLFEHNARPTIAKIRKALGVSNKTEINLDTANKNLKGNITASAIRNVVSEWDSFSREEQIALVEDLLTITIKSALKKRLIEHWNFPVRTAVALCLLEFEPGHSNLSLKAINQLLPFLEQGEIFSKARQLAGYDYAIEEIEAAPRLAAPPELPNPIVNKALHELRRLVNAVIAEYGKPDAIRIEMARDLEMNTKRYKQFVKQQDANAKANKEAAAKYEEMVEKNPHLALSAHAGRKDKIKYRLWKDQDGRCVYSGKSIDLSTLFSAEIDVDHILPYSKSLDDSYMNKVVCYAGENRYKSNRTPIDAFGGSDKWTQITQAVNRWPKELRNKKNRFFTTEEELQKRDFISNQLNDTRYISRVALQYVTQLGVDVSVSKGITTSWLRSQWGLNNLLGDSNEKERTDHRHHAIDAAVIACVDRSFYKAMVGMAKDLERRRTEFDSREMHFDPPWMSFRADLQRSLNEMVVAHAPQYKLTGALHEETGAGFVEGIGTVYRADLDQGFELTQLKKIIDKEVRKLVESHLAKHDNNPKKAFAPNVTLFHKDGKTPIKRVRIVQAKTTEKKLRQSKYGVKNSQGEVFKWMPYGNMHHVEIIKDLKDGTYAGKFVTMMEASHRAKGINMPKQPIVQTNHGDGFEFVMALHINDMVSLPDGNGRTFYRVQKLERDSNRLMLRLHSAATLTKSTEERLSIFSLMKKMATRHRVNCIGKLVE